MYHAQLEERAASMKPERKQKKKIYGTHSVHWNLKEMCGEIGDIPLRIITSMDEQDREKLFKLHEVATELDQYSKYVPYDRMDDIWPSFVNAQITKLRESINEAVDEDEEGKISPELVSGIRTTHDFVVVKCGWIIRKIETMAETQVKRRMHLKLYSDPSSD